VIAIPKAVFGRMIEHAKAGFPNEACGILAGNAADSVTDFYPMKNMDNASISYFMDPKEQLSVFKDMRAKKLEMRGIFHSHVASEAYPSQKDVRLAFYPDVSYLIVSLSDMEKPVLRSFRIADEKVAEEPVKIGE
jgi:[CysO sulfur-carrier protein]-S-L-cysteine hydrolase